MVLTLRFVQDRLLLKHPYFFFRNSVITLIFMIDFLQLKLIQSVSQCSSTLWERRYQIKVKFKVQRDTREVKQLQPAVGLNTFVKTTSLKITRFFLEVWRFSPIILIPIWGVRTQTDWGAEKTESEIWSVQQSQSVVVISLARALLTPTTNMIARSPHLRKYHFYNRNI